MAHGTVSVVNPQTDETRIIPVGFSWTVLFWGCFPALFRQDWKHFAIMGVTLFITGLMLIAFIPLVVFAFIYNDKMCLKNLLNDGWKIKNYVGKKNLEVVGQSVGYNLDKFMA